ncbi:uncharacterized protein LOC115220940 [Octopus sinensis]|uniref:Uncharacterized protein LOC115220940 n=1 Tax=Octopus sinensis TaxID=2607531 RepID=A0A6P7T7V7_9MOLL|nr:uncharacterized protein LOC115220940 [Octopus sinensis]
MADRERRLSNGEDEVLDPRIQIELEQLNKASEEINTLELELDDARAAFRQELSESTQKLNAMSKKLGACIDKARPYYDARMRAKEAHIETQKAAVRYERACSMHEAAKEMVHLAEQGYMKRDQPSDPAWQEMLNHATMKVNEAEKERIESEQYHERTTKIFKEAEECVQQLQKDLKRSISKSKPYFEMKVKFNQVMDEQKHRVSRLETEVINTKSAYAEALRNLESISDEIHERRLEKSKHLQLGVRGSGVGSETPSPPPGQEKGSEIGDGTVVTHISTCTYSSNILTTPTTYQQSASKEPVTFSITTTSATVEQDSGVSQLKDDCDESEGSFVAPSVIFSSPEQARRLSYRQAIETNSYVSPNITSESISPSDFEEDYDAPSLEEEYISLPSYKSKVKNSNNFNFVSENQFCQQSVFSPDSHNPNSTPLLKSNEPQASLPTEKRATLKTLGKSKTEPGPNLQRVNSEMSECSPSVIRRSKLKGIILRVDAEMDPYMQGFQQRKISNVPSVKNINEGTKNESQPKNTKILNSNSETASPRKMGTVNKPHITPTKYVRGSEGSPVLKIPSPASDIMDDSDTESLASIGQMLDDEQVELLTLDFSDDTFINAADSVKSDRFQKTDWHRMSLPPKLSHLEYYLQSKSLDLTTTPTGRTDIGLENLELYENSVPEPQQVPTS